MPGDPGYGSALLGCLAAAVVTAAVMLLFDKQFDSDLPVQRRGNFEAVAVWLIIVVTLLNAGSVLLECGFGSCPADPVHYELLSAVR